MSSASAITLDLTAGGMGNINGGTFTTLENINVPTGTGVFMPFLRMQANGNSGVEQGYNTDRSPAGAVQFDEKVGVWTRSLQLQDIPLINGFYQFALDLGEPAVASKSLISLDMLQLFSTADSDIFGATYDASNQAAPFGASASKFWDLDDPAGPAASPDNEVILDYNLVGSGNGRADMAFLLPEIFFAGIAATDYIVMYSKFGGTFAAQGTFEEWAALTAPIPVPAALPLFLTALAGAGLIARRRRSRA